MLLAEAIGAMRWCSSISGVYSAGGLLRPFGTPTWTTKASPQYGFVCAIKGYGGITASGSAG
jgi:hypothetical protein